MTAIDSAMGSLDMARALLERSGQALAEGVVTPEVVSARDSAQVQIEFKTQVLSEALATESAILDLLV